MKRLIRNVSGVMALLAAAATARAQALQSVQSALLYAVTNDFQRGVNWQSPTGVPLSTTANNPPGSDGRIPAGQLTATPGQFQGVVTFAAVTVTTNASALNTSASFAANAEALNWPRAKDAGGQIRLVLRAQAGGSFVSQIFSFFFGSVIPVPQADINGQPFTDITAANSYWIPEPFTTNNHAGDSYYWSKHAGKVFAVQPGDVNVTWRRATPLPNTFDNPPADFAGNENVKYAVIGGSYYQLLQTRYGVSDGSVKLTRHMYWTEGLFAVTGKKVSVPTARVKDIRFVYNTAFPQNVASNEVYVANSNTSLFGNNGALLDTRTLWFENGMISANNKEGRVFMELLGNSLGGDVREHLGFEIVDVNQEPVPSDVTVELGERLSAYQDNSPADTNLFPSPILNATGLNYIYQQFLGADGAMNLYATRVTKDVNDSRAHWLEESIGGLHWPFRLVRYKQVWPTDVAKYSHFVRPTVSDDISAQATAIELPIQDLPTVDYEDPTDIVRSKFTADQKFYTFLDTNYPALRTLIRYNNGDQVSFERVFSWLDTNLRATNFANTVATNLSAWNPTNTTFIWPNALKAPRVVNATAWVGQRLAAPADDTYTNTAVSYFAGYIRQDKGTGFSVSAYKDPLDLGISNAVASSIIPITASNNNATLEVWWFRPNNADTARGFTKTYWPSIISHYTVYWPTSAPAAREIILASNAGSGPLTSLESKGALYIQNDPSLPGYNPNEEHALMQGGQVWALRDDLNITNAVGYSSHPYVLLEYTDADGRPSMTPFQVIREKGNVVFDYTRYAGGILQAPMPLPLLEKPLGAKPVGSPARSFNTEIKQHTVSGGAQSEAGGFSQVTLITATRHFYQPYESLALQTVSAQGLLTSRTFFTTNVNSASNQINGVISLTPPRTLGIWTSTSQPADPTRYRFLVTSLSGLSPTVIIANPALQTNWTATVAALGTVSGNAYVEIQFTGNVPAAAQTNTVLIVPQGGQIATSFNGWRLAYEALTDSITDPVLRDRYASFTFQDRKGDTWFYRGPHSADSGGKVVMQYYYKTLDGFYFPSLPTNAQPVAGTITPYLRPRNPDGSFAGNPVLADANGDNQPDGNALGIVYRPVWPEVVPVLMMAESLTVPKRGLPAVRGQTSLDVLYQQPQFIGGPTARAAVLHDPTREKQFNLGPSGSTSVLGKLPDSLRTSVYQGLTYFPNLPPHLVDRFFYDPNRGSNGALVLRGQFQQETVGESYLLLNVLGSQDAGVLRGLCTADDPRKALWDAVINTGLTTSMQQFVEDPARPGTFKAGPSETVGPSALAEVKNQDVAVDSYALTATGPGIGYITLVAGNGTAFTPDTEPVSVQIIKVVDTLYRGELKVVKSSNPLSEIVTLQQVVDLAARTDDYDFQWLIAAPVNGVPPPVYQNTPRQLLGDGTWNHIRFPLPTDQAATVHLTDPSRVIPEVTTAVIPLSFISFSAVSTNDGNLNFILQPGIRHPLIAGTPLTVRDVTGAEFTGSLLSVSETNYQSQTTTNIVVSLDPGQINIPTSLQVLQLYERSVAGQPQSIVFREVAISDASDYSQYYLSLDLDPALKAGVYLDGQLVVNANFGLADTVTSVAPGGFNPLPRTYLLGPDLFGGGVRTNGATKHQIAVLFYSAASPGALLNFNLRLEAYESVDQTAVPGSQWLPLDPAKTADKVRAIIGTGADVRALSDNYLISRYRATNTTHASYSRGFSRWTEPQLAEGWIKRVLAGINPFNQRVSDLFNNRVNTDVSILTQAGHRWEGDVALNLANINNSGLIEIYETVLRRGRTISVDSGINYGPANDALLLAAGYLNDLYMMLGNEAWADAANPTIGIGTKDPQHGDIATSLFAFKGQVPSLLEEELGLLRGRDDFLQPGVQAKPVYNRLFWNYTRGIDAGEVIYALNYNIQPLPGSSAVDASAAAYMFPQGHGDAYGHYLTAMKDFFSLFISPSFDWVPHPEAVSVLGQPVEVNYQNERKFATAAAALARAGHQVLDLTWRRDFVPGGDSGWSSLSVTATNTGRDVPTTRYWGVDHWASRTMQGAYYNWALGNAILPAVDPDPTHEGIQKVDRTTVPELLELPDTAQAVQLALDNAEGHFTPLGLPAGSLAFDINPSQVTGASSMTHFEQIYDRAKRALGNAVAAFDDAKDVTRLMRTEQDSLTDLQTAVNKQELAYTNTLIELYGSPYPDDVGPGKTYSTDYAGPDLIHFAYVETPELSFANLYDPSQAKTFTVSMGDQAPPNTLLGNILDLIHRGINNDPSFKNSTRSISFTVDPHGFFQKPTDWTSRRVSPGKVQDAISRIIIARNNLVGALQEDEDDKLTLDRLSQLVEVRVASNKKQQQTDLINAIKADYAAFKAFKFKMQEQAQDTAKEVEKTVVASTEEALPKSMIAGLAAGGDLTSPARAAVGAASATSTGIKGALKSAYAYALYYNDFITFERSNIVSATLIEPLKRQIADAPLVNEAEKTLHQLTAQIFNINRRVQELDDARRHYRTLLAQGDRIQAEREIFRQRTAAIIQGYRTRDAGYRIFREEKLERYKTLFDLAAEYTFMAANAYDYETGLLNTPKGKLFVNRIVNSRALGVVKDGEPQYAGSNTGDPGLSSVLAEMKADWDVLRGRLGFNNPSGYGTTVSLRTENFRIVRGSEGDTTWKDILNQGRQANLLDDPDVKRNCMQIDPGNGLPVPGIVVEFSTSITDGNNLFGRQLAGGDHYFDSSYFATKIFSVGVAFEGYIGMDNPAANSSTVSSSGGTSPTDPTAAFLDPQSLAATPGIYLIPAGQDAMRSPPLGDTSAIRTWSVNDITIPLPFNIGGSDFSTKPLYRSGDSLSEPLFNLRKHPAFRPVSTTAAFNNNIYGGNGQLQLSQFTNTRLIGRSVWNTRWKLVIPGYKLLNDPNDGLDRFVNTVKDIKLYYVTYSYAGN